MIRRTMLRESGFRDAALITVALGGVCLGSVTLVGSHLASPSLVRAAGGFILVGGAILLVCAAFSARARRAASRQWLHALAQIGEGNFDVRIERSGEIAHAFNQMAERLRQCQDHLQQQAETRAAELSAMNRELENQVTERRRAEEAVLDSEQRLRTLLDTVCTGVIVIDPLTSVILDVNQSAAHLVGLPKDQIIGRSCHHFICPAGEGDCPIRDLGDTSDKLESVLLNADGNSLPILRSATRRVLQGKECLIESFIEITELKKAQEDLKESVSLLNATLESTADGILVVDRSGKIKSFNSPFISVWKTPDTVLSHGSDDEVLAFAMSQIKNPDGFVATIRGLHDDPSSESFDTLELLDGRVIERYSKPQRIGDRIIGRVWSFRDVTDKHGAEQKQADLLHRVADINEELTHFAYVVSHDLKAPLRGIKLLTEWLCTDYGDKLGDQAKEQLDLLQSRVQRMHNLIEGVLQYSRVGRITEEMVTVDLNELVPSIVDTIAPPSHIHITTEGVLPSLVCERTRITQVFQNLLTNAVKYMDKPEGSILVACEDEGGAWRFSVTDNGPGIEERYFERIFKIFQTLAPKDEYESTGVGLTLVKKIVELYGGKVWVESQVGQGSTFLFTWPKQKAAVACEAPQPVLV